MASRSVASSSRSVSYSGPSSFSKRRRNHEASAGLRPPVDTVTSNAPLRRTDGSVNEQLSGSSAPLTHTPAASPSVNTARLTSGESVAATGDATVDGAIFADAEAAGGWVNAADDPEHCSFTLPAVVRRGGLLVTVSTSGRSPALASWLRERLEGELGPEYEALLDLLAAEREALRAAGRATEGLDWQKALDSDMLDLVRNGQLGQARERLQACLSSSSD